MSLNKQQVKWPRSSPSKILFRSTSGPGCWSPPKLQQFRPSLPTLASPRPRYSGRTSTTPTRRSWTRQVRA
ncbi:hypothetical protein AG1IA_10083 [Rhizoctonia solani AG-1 IA]|uniref:Uncharacterized protein n=1 Tax=Thanatephorus cucumeris (strain AG1-IA) TaxID=983506 RepID=L8WGP4_THACA|nr:hypothetical protein AG1IA_10083 [Rhizoctonia solani AG-1 IA]